MIFLLAYLYVHYLVFVPMVMHIHIKLMNSFGYWLIMYVIVELCFSPDWTG